MKKLFSRVFPYLLLTISPVSSLYAPQAPGYGLILVIVTVGMYLIALATFRQQWLDDLEAVRDERTRAYLEAQREAAAQPVKWNLTGAGKHTVSYKPGQVIFRTDIENGDVTHTFDPETARAFAGFLVTAADKAATPEQEPPSLWERLDQ